MADAYGKWFLARLKGLDAALERSDFYTADRFTGADISVGYALLLARTLGLDAQFPERVSAYWERLRARPGFKRAKAAQSEAAKAQGIAAASF